MEAEPPFRTRSSRGAGWGVGLALAGAGILLFAGGPLAQAAAPAGSSSSNAKRMKVMSTKKYEKPSQAELEKSLSPAQFQVTQHAGTEPPFRNEFWDNHEAGLYVDVATGEPLFSSTDKFDS